MQIGGFVAGAALQDIAVLVAVLVAVDVDAAAVVQLEGVVLDLLPAFAEDAFLFVDAVGLRPRAGASRADPDR